MNFHDSRRMLDLAWLGSSAAGVWCLVWWHGVLTLVERE